MLKKMGKKNVDNQDIANVWMFDSGRIFGSEWDLENAICKTLDIINSNTSFKTVFTTFKESFLRCYTYVEDYHIAFGLSPKVLYDIYKVGIPIEFDLYSLEDE